VVVLDVERGQVQQEWIVLELTKATVAVEAEEGPHRTGGVVMVDVLSRRSPADRTHAALLPEHRVDFLGTNPVSPGQVVGPAASSLLDAPFPAIVVAGQAVGGKAR